MKNLDDGRVLTGATSTSPNMALLIMFDTGLTSTQFIASTLGNCKVRKVSYYNGGAGNKRAYAYLEDLGIPN